MSQPEPPKAEPMAAPNDAELSRIAREAVHQPADPRLDRQLARMGVMEAAEPVAGPPGQPADRPAVSSVSSAEVERIGTRLRRVETLVGVLVVVVAILAFFVVILLFR